MASESSAFEERLGEIEAEMEDRRRALDEMEVEENRLRQEAAQAIEERRLGGDILHLLGREESRLSLLLDGAGAAVTDAKVELAQAEAMCRSVAERVRRLEEGAEEKGTRIQRLEQAAAEGRAKAARLRAQVAEMVAELKELVTRRAAVQDQLARDEPSTRRG